MNRQQSKTKKITTIGILSAISAILMFVEFPLPFFPPFLNMDFSDVPALFAALALGPAAGVAVELIKCLLHLLATKSAGVGELASFICGAAYVYVAGTIYFVKKTRNNAIFAMLIATLATTLIAALVNIFILLPAYQWLLGISSSAVVSMAQAVNPAVKNINQLILYAIIPFNIFKWFLSSLIVYLVYKKLSHYFH
ncbi:MAG: ECF transporter S component [Negativicutes bacterium]|jgi:riboflavin transporter FmnP